MLILSSNGLTSEAIRSELRLHTAGLRSAALVVTADDVYKEKNYHVPGAMDDLQAMGLSATVVDIDHTPARELEQYDLVEFIGGNPFYLLNSIRRHHAGPVLERVAREKILVGWSAAAFVFGPTLSLVHRYSPEMNTPGLTDLSAVGLTTVQVLPHYSRFQRKFAHFEEICAEYEQVTGVSVVRLNDGDAVFIDGEHTTLVRHDPAGTT